MLRLRGKRRADGLVGRRRDTLHEETTLMAPANIYNANSRRVDLRDDRPEIVECRRDRAGELRSAPSEPDDRHRATG